MRCAGLNTGSDIHLLDHIAPLAELMEMPLIVTEERNFELCRHYYPQVSVQYMPDLEFKLGTLAANYDALFECKYWAPHLKALFRDLFKKEMKLVFCPHGQSDKGFQAPLLAPYAMQDRVLLYGDLMREMLQKLEVPLPRHTFVGNYRFSFYQKHRTFYKELVEKEIFSQFAKKQPTLLYAPTWRDADGATSFFSFGAKVLNELPESWNLILKLHPLLEQRDPAQFYAIAALADRKPNLVLLTEFPPVYPLLSKVDAYLGDSSSVGYDFLLQKRPMFFLTGKESHRLHSCGQIVDSLSFLNQPFHPLFTLKQEELYSQAFGPSEDPKKIKDRILEILR